MEPLYGDVKDKTRIEAVFDQVKREWKDNGRSMGSTKSQAETLYHLAQQRKGQA